MIIIATGLMQNLKTQSSLHRLASVAQLDAHQMGDQGVVGLIPGRQQSFVEIDHGIFSVVILLAAYSRKAVVSFWWKKTYTILVNY